MRACKTGRESVPLLWWPGREPASYFMRGGHAIH